MRLGILGGTFDPVHYGHLLLAECCREQRLLDQVWFLPAATPPHKQAKRQSPAADRVEMLELATGGNPAFSVNRHEVDRGGVNYTADTLEALGAEDPRRELFFLLGSDSLDDLPNWHDPQRICRAATLVVVRRGGGPKPDLSCLTGIANKERIETIGRMMVEMPAIELSSTEIRRRVAAGKSIRYRTPRAVEKYIEAQRLYQASCDAAHDEPAASGDFADT